MNTKINGSFVVHIEILLAHCGRELCRLTCKFVFETVREICTWLCTSRHKQKLPTIWYFFITLYHFYCNGGGKNKAGDKAVTYLLIESPFVLQVLTNIVIRTGNQSTKKKDITVSTISTGEDNLSLSAQDFLKNKHQQREKLAQALLMFTGLQRSWT